MSKKAFETGGSSGMANPYLDSQFKKIFDEENACAFLNSILRPEHPIESVEFLNTESNDTSQYGKRVYFDVLCRDTTGSQFIVEMQNLWKNYLRNRIVYYACRKVSEMGRKYERKKNPDEDPWDYGIKPVCVICLLNDTDRDLPEQYYRQDAVLYDTWNNRVFSDKLRIIMINLPILKTKTMGVESEYFENYLLLLNQISQNMKTVDELLSEIEAGPFDEKQKEIFRRVVNRSSINAMSEKERLQYDEEEKYYMDMMAEWYERDHCVEMGEARGEARGKAEERSFWHEVLVKHGFTAQQIEAIEASARTIS